MATVERQLQQLPNDTVVHGATRLATLSVDPTELAERTGIDWIEDRDELGPYRAAMIATRAEHPFVLLSYLDSPVVETSVLGPRESIDDLDALLGALGLSPEVVIDRVDRSGVAPEGEIATTLLETVESVDARVHAMQRELEFTRRAMFRLLSQSPELDLTPRQRQVLRYVGAGLSADQIATRLGVSRSAVLSHFRTARNALVHHVPTR